MSWIDLTGEIAEEFESCTSYESGRRLEFDYAIIRRAVRKERKRELSYRERRAAALCGVSRCPRAATNGTMCAACHAARRAYVAKRRAQTKSGRRERKPDLSYRERRAAGLCGVSRCPRPATRGCLCAECHEARRLYIAKRRVQVDGPRHVGCPDCGARSPTHRCPRAVPAKAA